MLSRCTIPAASLAGVAVWQAGEFPYSYASVMRLQVPERYTVLIARTGKESLTLSFKLRNVVILMAIELILLSVNINLVAFSVYSGTISGQIFAMLVLTVAAAEAAVGLAILVVYFRNRGDIAVESVDLMKG